MTEVAGVQPASIGEPDVVLEQGKGGGRLDDRITPRRRWRRALWVLIVPHVVRVARQRVPSA